MDNWLEETEQTYKAILRDYSSEDLVSTLANARDNADMLVREIDLSQTRTEVKLEQLRNLVAYIDVVQAELSKRISRIVHVEGGE